MTPGTNPAGRRCAMAIAGLAFCAVAGPLQSAEGIPATPELVRPSLDRLRQRSESDGSARTIELDETRQRERVELLVQGEAALARGDVETALRAFERAASMRHAADSEMALVRAYMQGGYYRRAVTFSAHTAGAHAGAAGASALYAWLLLLGGQRTAAQRLVADAAGPAPGDPALVYVRAATTGTAAPGERVPLRRPARFAPYASGTAVPAKAQVIGSGTLVDDGRRVVVPTAVLAGVRVVWIRNGLGETVRGRVEQMSPPGGAALVRLERSIPMPAGMHLAPRDPFPGSIVYLVEFGPDPDAAPGWPQLHAGFAGAAVATTNGRRLGVDLAPGPRGGPVFDAQGRLVGVALPGRGGRDELLLPSQLRPHIVQGETTTTPGFAPPLGIDEIYERSLRVAVQVLAVR
jgi:hypothetical protein